MPPQVSFLRNLYLGNIYNTDDVYHIYVKAKKEQGIKLHVQYDYNYVNEKY